MIEFQNITVDFKQKTGKLAAVKDVSFSIEENQIFGIIGSSGAGKSTLLRTINLLQPVTGGDVLVNSEKVTNYRGKKLREHRRGIGMIFQHFNLASNLTVRQNIAFVLKTAGYTKTETYYKVDEYLTLVNLSEKADSYPAKLSGGQKQRVAIARALAGGAKILLCDEPTSALDAESTASILSLIKSLSKTLGITVVIITHELEVIKNICGRCAVMTGGQLVEIGDTYKIFTEPQNEYTRQLLQNSQDSKLPVKVLELTNGIIIKLTFQGNGATTPVISQATEKFAVQFNILAGRVEYIGDMPFGVLYVNPVGEVGAIESALKYLGETVHKVEVVENARL